MAAIQPRTRAGRKVWLVQIRLKGLRPVSRQFLDRKVAEAWAKEEERRLAKLREVGGVAPEIGTITLSDLVERYLADPGVKALDTYEERVRQLGHWVEVYGSQKVRSFGPMQLLERRDALLDAGRTPATVNRYIAALRKCWNWGRAVRLIDPSAVWPGGVMLAENNTRARFLSDDELKAVLKAARKESATLYAAVVVSLATGVRQSELLALEWRDVDFDAAAITIRKTKNDTPRSVHLPASAVQVLRGLRRGKVVSKRVFLDEEGVPLECGSLVRAWRRIRDEAKLQDFRWHDLRHSCASYLAQHGASLPEIASVLGHKSLQATQRYAHLVPGKPVTGHDKLNAKLGPSRSS